jgi:hypothetical protein
MPVALFFPRCIVVVGALLASLAPVSAIAQAPQRARPNATPLVEIRTSDVDLFYRIYDAAGGAPSADALQHDYIDAGSDGVRQFVPQELLHACQGQAHGNESVA